MRRDDEKLFEDLAPPPGGKERFRQRLEAYDDRARSSVARLVPAALAASAAVVVIAVIAVVRFDGGAGPTPAGESAPSPGGDSGLTAAGDAGSENAGASDPRAGDVYRSRAFDRLLGRPMQPAEFSVAINDEPVAVTEMPSANRRIRIYRIESD